MDFFFNYVVDSHKLVQAGEVKWRENTLKVKKKTKVTQVVKSHDLSIHTPVLKALESATPLIKRHHEDQRALQRAVHQNSQTR